MVNVKLGNPKNQQSWEFQTLRYAYTTVLLSLGCLWSKSRDRDNFCHTLSEMPWHACLKHQDLPWIQLSFSSILLGSTQIHVKTRECLVESIPESWRAHDIYARRRQKWPCICRDTWPGSDGNRYLSTSRGNLVILSYTKQFGADYFKKQHVKAWGEHKSRATARDVPLGLKAWGPSENLWSKGNTPFCNAFWQHSRSGLWVVIGLGSGPFEPSFPLPHMLKSVLCIAMLDVLSSMIFKRPHHHLEAPASIVIQDEPVVQDRLEPLLWNKLTFWGGKCETSSGMEASSEFVLSQHRQMSIPFACCWYFFIQFSFQGHRNFMNFPKFQSQAYFSQGQCRLSWLRCRIFLLIVNQNALGLHDYIDYMVTTRSTSESKQGWSLSAFLSSAFLPCMYPSGLVWCI